MAKHAGGRPKVRIDWKEFDKLCLIQCTLMEIATWFNCSEDTIENRVRQEKGVSFSEYFNRKRAGGFVSLRRAQFALAEKYPAMAIFLGKNYLRQADRTEISNPEGESFRVVHSAKDKILKLLERISTSRERDKKGESE